MKKRSRKNDIMFCHVLLQNISSKIRWLLGKWMKMMGIFNLFSDTTACCLEMIAPEDTREWKAL